MDEQAIKLSYTTVTWTFDFYFYLENYKVPEVVTLQQVS